jgi:ABC-type multidrug transport system ATPase subunit
MDIELQGLGKRFHRDWIFRDLSYQFAHGSKTAITGSNGAGKSTLLKILGNYTLQSEGKVIFSKGGIITDDEDAQLSINFAAPYFNVIEEYTLVEFLNFHAKFKKPISNIDNAIDSIGLNGAKNKIIKDFSSGMKQRVKLILALCFESEIILLDEPTSNLDDEGIKWFEQKVNAIEHKTVIIASNLTNEINLCDEKINLKKM